MRTGFSESILNWIRRPDADFAVVPEAMIESLAPHILQKKTDWDRADSLTNFTKRDDGGLELTPSNAALISHGSSDTNITLLDRRAGQFQVAKVSFLGTEPADLALSAFTARLHPKVDGGAAKEVAFWEMHLYTRVSIDVSQFNIAGVTTVEELVELCDPCVIEATGTAEADYVFDFTAAASWPRRRWIGAWLAPRPKANGYTDMYIEIRPLKADGATAGNVGWRKDSLTTEVTTSGNVMTGVTLTPSTYYLSNSEQWVESALSQTPRIAIQRLSATGLTVTFATNPMDLGAVPSGLVEFTGQGATPGGSSFTFQVRNNADTDWITFTDGQTNEDVGVSLRQTYKMQAIYNVAGTNIVTPILYQLGVRNVVLQSFKDLATVEGRQGATDPFTLKSEIAEVRIHAIQDGERDFRDALTTLLSSYTIGQINWRIWVETPSGRALIDTFITDDVITEPDGSVTIVAISPLSLLATHLPVIKADPITDFAITSITRTGDVATVTTTAAHGFGAGETIVIEGASPAAYNGPKGILSDPLPTATTLAYMVEGTPSTPATGTITYYKPAQVAVLDYSSLDSIKDRMADIVDNQMVLPGRWRGSLCEDSTTLVAKTIEDSDAWDELNALAFLAGGTLLSSQGRLQYKDIFGAKVIARVLALEEVKWGSVSAGYSQRKPIFRVPYDYDRTFDAYRNEARAFNQIALDATGQPWGDIDDLDDLTAQWIRSVPVTSITRAGAVATVTTQYDHGLTSGQTVTIHGAEGDGAKEEVKGGYNGEVVVTVTGSTTFTYPISGTPTSPATGAIYCSILPHVVSNRTVFSFGVGRILLPFTTNYPYPELEIGDLVPVQTDRFIAKDPFGLRALKGKLWPFGVIVAIHDMAGTSFTVLVRSYADIVSGAISAPRVGYVVRPGIVRKAATCKVYNTGDQVMAEGNNNVLWDAEAFDEDDLHSIVSNTERITIKQAGVYVATLRLQWDNGAGGGRIDLMYTSPTAVATQLQIHDFGSALGPGIPATGEITLTATVRADPDGYFWARVALSVPGTNTLDVRGGAEYNSSLTVTQASASWDRGAL